MSLFANLSNHLQSLIPPAVNTPRREWLRAAAGLCVGMLMSSLLCLQFYGDQITLALIAPVGASAVLLFAVPSGNLSQPWPVLGSYLLAVMIGVLAYRLFGHSLSVAALAGGLTLLLMFPLRCVHPPGGAMALTVVLLDAGLDPLGLRILWPVMLSVGCLILAALLWNNLTGVRYPKHQPRHDLHHTSDPSTETRIGISEADLDAALASFGEFVDITRDDLERLIRRTERSALIRSMGDIRAEQIMSRDIRSVSLDTTVMQAIRLFRHHHVKTLPVVDNNRQVIGIVSLSDLLAQLDLPVARLLPARINLWRDQPLGKLMTKPVVTVDGKSHVADMIPLMSAHGLHCLPVIEHGRLAGLITQTDLIAALHRQLLNRQ